MPLTGIDTGPFSVGSNLRTNCQTSILFIETMWSGQVVSPHASYSDDPSLNSADSVNCVDRTKNKLKRGLVFPFKNKCFVLLTVVWFVHCRGLHLVLINLVHFTLIFNTGGFVSWTFKHVCPSIETVASMRALSPISMIAIVKFKEQIWAFFLSTTFA